MTTGARVAGRAARASEPARDPDLQRDHEHGVEREQCRADGWVDRGRQHPRRQRHHQHAVMEREDTVQPEQRRGARLTEHLAEGGARFRITRRSGARETGHEGGADDVRRSVRQHGGDDGRVAVGEQDGRGGQGAQAIAQVAPRLLPREDADPVPAQPQGEDGGAGALHPRGHLQDGRGHQDCYERPRLGVAGERHGAGQEAARDHPAGIEPAEQSSRDQGRQRPRQPRQGEHQPDVGQREADRAVQVDDGDRYEQPGAGAVDQGNGEQPGDSRRTTQADGFAHAT